jgi:hypothetical protein
VGSLFAKAIRPPTLWDGFQIRSANLEIRNKFRFLKCKKKGASFPPLKHLICFVLRYSNFEFNAYGMGVFFEKNQKKARKVFKISLFCPLIIATKGDAMINNMVLSREIEWIGYEHKRNMLQVEFIVGSIYQYENVPETVYQEFLTAPSHGRFFESNIKNKYHVRKVR